jgi:hypothetical protein
MPSMISTSAVVACLFLSGGADASARSFRSLNTLPIRSLANAIPDATVCRGYSCDTEGQFCPPSAPGGSPFFSSYKGFTCCAGRWKDGGKQTCPNSAHTLPKYTGQFDNIGSGKCTVNNGQDPKSQYLTNTNENQCKRACRQNSACSGYSAANTGNCLLWLEGPLDSNNRYGGQWGGASCNVRQQKRRRLFLRRNFRGDTRK